MPRAHLSIGRIGLALVVTLVVAASATRGPAQAPSAEERRRAASERALARVLERADRALAGGRRERALSILEAGSERPGASPRLALAFCSVAVPETDATAQLVIERAPGAADLAERCGALIDRFVQAGAGTEPDGARLATVGAWARALLGDRTPALAILAGRTLDERDVPVLRRLALLALSDGSLEDADTALSLARRVRPNDLELASDLGAVRLARGDASSAVTLFRTVVAGHPGDRGALHDLAGAYLQAGERERALAAYEQLAREEPRVASRWLDLARARTEAGDLAGAARDARVAVGLSDEGDPSALLVLGDVLRLAADEAGARAAYEEALRREPTSSRARRGLDALTARISCPDTRCCPSGQTNCQEPLPPAE